MQKIIALFEWIFGILALGGATLSFLFVMFTDNPSFESKLTPLQKIFFETQGYWVLIIVGGVFLSFVLQFFVKSFPWNHIVGATGIFGFICLFIFFSAYF